MKIQIEPIIFHTTDKESATDKQINCNNLQATNYTDLQLDLL